MNSPAAGPVTASRYDFRDSAYLAIINHKLEQWQTELRCNKNPQYGFSRPVDFQPSPQSSLVVTPDPFNTSNPLHNWNAKFRREQLQISHMETNESYAQSIQYWERKFHYNNELLLILHALRKKFMTSKGDLGNLRDGHQKRKRMQDDIGLPSEMFKRPQRRSNRGTFRTIQGSRPLSEETLGCQRIAIGSASENPRMTSSTADKSDDVYLCGGHQLRKSSSVKRKLE